MSRKNACINCKNGECCDTIAQRILLMSFLRYAFFILFLSPLEIFAISTRIATVSEKNTPSPGFFDSFIDVLTFFVDSILFIIFFFVVLRIVRLMYEVIMSKQLVYMKVTLPRADSKLDKEKETKKDFKEKAGVMSVVFKSVHKMAETSFLITL